MPSVSQGVFVLAIVWTLWRIVRIRRQLRRGDVLIPPLVVGTLVFALGIIAVMVTGVSPLHLVWWFPCSFIVGLAVLLFPLGTRLLLGFLVLLAMPMESSGPTQPLAGKDARVGRRKRKSRKSARTRRTRRRR
jgi:hypothetical protein